MATFMGQNRSVIIEKSPFPDGQPALPTGSDLPNRNGACPTGVFGERNSRESCPPRGGRVNE